MRSTVAARMRKPLAAFFAAALVLGLVPTAAFAAPENTDAADAAADIQAEAEASAYDLTSDAAEAAAGTEPVGDAPASPDGKGRAEEGVETGGGSNLAIPAGDIINQEMPLEVVAQAESTRSFFLAQTLESTKTVPVVSAKLPIDTGSAAEAEAPAEGEGSAAEDEGAEDPDEADLLAPTVSADSTVVGSFTYEGITYAVEPGGESVAVVAADCAKLPEEFVEAQAIVLPSAAMAGNGELYTVARIADDAFAGLAPAAEEDGEADGSIIALSIPASITQIDEEAFSGFSTLQYLLVDEDNSFYGSYDGCMYDADLISLLLIPEER